jgi:hypothetical protein
MLLVLVRAQVKPEVCNMQMNKEKERVDLIPEIPEMARERDRETERYK